MRGCPQWIAPSAAKGLRPAAAAFCQKNLQIPVLFKHSLSTSMQENGPGWGIKGNGCV